MKARVGDVVMTEFDDSDQPLKARVVETWRGHRGPRYKVQMEDETTEEISEDQILIKQQEKS